MLSNHQKKILAVMVGGNEMGFPLPSREEVIPLLADPEITYQESAQILWGDSVTHEILVEIAIHVWIFLLVTDETVFQQHYPEACSLLESV